MAAPSARRRRRQGHMSGAQGAAAQRDRWIRPCRCSGSPRVARGVGGVLARGRRGARVEASAASQGVAVLDRLRRPQLRRENKRETGGLVMS